MTSATDPKDDERRLADPNGAEPGAEACVCPASASSGWYVYVLRCGDGSLYTGVAKDVQARLDQHAAGRGARYTRGRGPFSLAGVTGPMAQGDALRLELAVKAQRPARKLAYLHAAPAGRR